MEYPTMLAKKFEDQVKKTPDKIAVKTETEKYTYQELNRYANRIARHISGAAVGGTVGLLFQHGVHMIAAILGALKAGKVYVPMSVDYPANRLSYMLSDSESSLLITDKSYASFARDLTGPINIPVLDLHPAPPGETGDEDENPGQEIPGESIAYILYTSGSTGRPKGVVQTHQNADYYNMNWVRVFSITASDRMTLFSSFCHDGSVQDMYSALHSGATLYPLNMKQRESTSDLSEFLNREAITIWHSVPSLFTYFANTLEGNENFPALRFILLGGEPVRQHEVELFKKYFPHSTLANVYGQTESSVNSICLITGDQRYKKPIIGTPLEETGIFVVDDEGSPVDTLEAGEIVVACKYLSPGYWKNPEAVEKVFGEDEALGRLYWTGDLGCLLADGNIEFLGRKDLQVKIRGFRVEPGEIETQLLKHNKIKEAVVTLLEDEKNDKYLSAYIVTADTGEKIEVSELRNFLSQELPDYMVPGFFVFLEQMPLTPNGKIDRKALPKSVEQEKDENYTAPRDEVEEKLAALWAEVLGIEREKIGIDTDFFQLGGHSLKAVILASKIQKEFNVGILLGDILKAPFIRAMAQIARESDKTGFIELENSETKEFYPLSFSQHRLFILHQFNPRSPAYNMPMRVELRLNPETAESMVEKVIRILVERHESLRTGFKTTEHEPVQYVVDAVDLPFRFVDISSSEKKEKQEK
jgi:amino acid adenylation domain-containing protein